MQTFHRLVNSMISSKSHGSHHKNHAMTGMCALFIAILLCRERT